MNSKFSTKETWLMAALLALLAGLPAGCDQDGVKVYKVADQDSSAATPPTATAPAGMTAPAAGDQSAAPQLKWTLPDGWSQKAAGEMRLASFSAPGKDGQLVDISIVPLPGLAGGDLNNVNRWRGQVGLNPVQETDLAGLAKTISVGDAPAPLYDQAGTPPGAGVKTRILAVALHRPDMMWFFKATGDDDSIGLQKANFIAWLKSIQFVATAADLPAGHPDIDAQATPAPALAAGAPDAGAAPALPTWTIPAAWQSQAPSAMLLAKFTATENGQAAEVTVSSFPGDVGGLLANINRWRRQVALAPLADADLAQAVTPLTTAAGQASVVDITGTDAKTSQPARLVGVILPLNGQSWFYKFMGDATVIDHQKADFLNFVQSAKY
jgi:hypothetical protein